jgi:hypothetical protein
MPIPWVKIVISLFNEVKVLGGGIAQNQYK